MSVSVGECCGHLHAVSTLCVSIHLFEKRKIFLKINLQCFDSYEGFKESTCVTD